ncbi:hypothetical protein DFJ77DRAFT_446122 [Powellomyces hirtus]|nr:hypothetical protein DFJ77DRAFT_446122 [Powellomyces hirtus]
MLTTRDTDSGLLTPLSLTHESDDVPLLLRALSEWTHASASDMTSAERFLRRLVKCFQVCFAAHGDPSAGLFSPLFWQPSQSTDSTIPAATAIGLFAELLRTVPPSSENWREAVGVVQVLFRNRLWRPYVEEAASQLIACLVRGVSHGGETQTTILWMLEHLTADGCSLNHDHRETVEIAATLAKLISTEDAPPPLSAVAVFGNLCRHPIFRTSLTQMPHLNDLLRQLINLISDDDLALVLHSLRILAQLVDTNTIVQSLFSDANLAEARRVMMAVLTNPDEDAKAHAAAVDLMRVLLTEGDLKRSGADDVKILRVPLKTLSARAEDFPQLFNLTAVLLSHSTVPQKLLPLLIQLGVAPKAMSYVFEAVATGPRPGEGDDDSSLAQADGVRYACSALTALIDTMHHEAVAQAEFDALASHLIPSVPQLLNRVSAALLPPRLNSNSVDEDEDVTQLEALAVPAGPSAIRPTSELLLALLRYRPFELDRRDLADVDHAALKVALMEYRSAPGWSEEVEVLMLAVQQAVGDVLRRDPGKSPTPSQASPPVHDGAYLARLMTRSTSSPVVIHACVAVLAQSTPDVWTSFGVAMCEAASRRCESRAVDVAAEVTVQGEPRICKPQTHPPTPHERTPKRETHVNVRPSASPADLDEDELSAAIHSARANAVDAVKEMQRAADLADQKIARLQKQLGVLQHKLQEKDDHIREINETASAAAHQAEVYEETVGALETRLTAALAVARTQSEEYARLEVEREKSARDAAESAKRVSRELAAARDELAKSTSQITQLEIDAAQTASAHQARESELQQENNKLADSLHEAESIRDSLTQTTTTQQSAITTLREKLKATRQELKTLHIEYEELERVHEMMRHSIASTLAPLGHLTRRTKSVLAVEADEEDSPVAQKVVELELEDDVDDLATLMKQMSSAEY